jgi:transposase
MKDFLPKEKVNALKKAHRAAKSKREADRIKTILFLNQGFDYEETARLLMLDDSTARTYYREYQQGGLDELVKDYYVGKQSTLTAYQEHFLKLHLRIRTYLTTQDVAVYVDGRFGIAYSVGGMTKLLHRLGFTYKKPKVVPGKADALKQAEFLKAYRELQANKSSEDHIYFVDGVHPHHNAIPAYGWIEKGQDKHLKTNTGRQRLNLNGALNSEDITDVEILSEPTLNADAMIRLCERLLAKHISGIIYLILDNARYYRAKKVAEFARDHPRIVLKFLPSYSPNLNLIERLWLFFQKKILYNRYYQDFATFENICLYFFRDLKRYRPQLKTLLADNFQIVAA